MTAAEACLSHDGTDLLSAIDAPTLVIGGTEDRVFPAAILDEPPAGIPDARLELVGAVGHGGYEERPNAWNAPIRAFLDG